MCPIPPTTFLNELAVNEAVPQKFRAVAARHVELVNLQNATRGASMRGSRPAPRAEEFHCTIYSMNNKAYPAFIAEEMNNRLHHGQQRYDEDDIRDMMLEGKLDESAILELPGELIQQGDEIHPTRIFASNEDGSYPADPVRQACYDNFRKVWKFYNTVMGRDSIDGEGLEIRAVIHVGRGYANASWDSKKRMMFFGDGGRFDGRGWLAPTDDPELKNLDFSDAAFAKKLKDDPDFEDRLLDKLYKAEVLTNWESPLTLDITGHELTHGVVHYTAALGDLQWAAKDYPAYREAGTLNEHIADCFGIMIKQWDQNQTAATGSWDMGEKWYSKTAMDIAIKNNRGEQVKYAWNQSYMRTFRVPSGNVTSQPDRGPKKVADMENITGNTDPHENCGVLNHAFYLAALEFQKKDGIPIWETIGRVWYNALRDLDFRKLEKQTFKGWRDLTLKWAKLLGSGYEPLLAEAWKAVGL